MRRDEIANRSRLAALFLASLSMTAVILCGPADAQTIGQKYHTREPRSCASQKNPAQGAPTPAIAAQYVICAEERVSGDYLYLVTGVRVEVGSGTPYLKLGQGARPAEADYNGIVYAIRGAFQEYQCQAPSGFTPAGKQCTLYDETNATGQCYRTQFHDWRCDMTDFNARYGKPDMPPPGGY